MLKVGTRVKYIRGDTEEDKATGYYPPIGTLGTIVTADTCGYQVQWDEGTKGNGMWYCDCTDVEEEMKCSNIMNFDAFTPSWYVYADDEGNIRSCTFDGDVEANQFFTDVSYRIAFDDCSGETVHKIYFKGKEVEYVGWQPGMKYEYRDIYGNTVWVGVFEHWDH